MNITQSGIIVYCILAAVVIFGTLVSLSSTYDIRRYRNRALLAAYVLGVVSLFVVPILWAVMIWGAVGILVGVAYAAYEFWSERRNPSEEPESGVRLNHLMYGLIAWPLMLMEVVEYSYAELRGSDMTQSNRDA